MSARGMMQRASGSTEPLGPTVQPYGGQTGGAELVAGHITTSEDLEANLHFAFRGGPTKNHPVNFPREVLSFWHSLRE